MKNIRMESKRSVLLNHLRLNKSSLEFIMCQLVIGQFEHFQFSSSIVLFMFHLIPCFTERGTVTPEVSRVLVLYYGFCPLGRVFADQPTVRV